MPAKKPVKTVKASPKAKAKPAKVSKVASAKVVKKSSKPIADKQTKAQIITELAMDAGLEKKQVKTVLEAMKDLIERHMHPKGSGEVVLPDLGIKVRRIRKPATKARKGRNPFTGEEITIKAKPARNSIKVSAMKALKTLAE